MYRAQHFCLDKKRGLKISCAKLFLALGLLSISTACGLPTVTHPTSVPTLTKILSFTPELTQTLTTTPTTIKTIIPQPTATVTASSTPTVLPSETSQPTATPKPFLISYTGFQDGGDELGICLRGVSRPTFILYADGQLVFLRDGQYWQALLSQDEISALFTRLLNTGLFLHSEKEYNEGNSELVVLDKAYYAPWNLPSADPLDEAIDIVVYYQPKEVQRYVPESILLQIYKIDPIYLDEIRERYPPSTTEVGNWDDDPLSKYGEVWELITGKEVEFLLSQFAYFPDYKILRKGDSYYIASICANRLP